MIQVKNLSKYYGKTEILKNINLNIEEGEIYGIIGHSGAGKSTLLRCFNELEEYNSGSLRVMNKEIKELNNKELRGLRKEVAMIFQSFNLLNSKNVYENVALPLELWGEKENIEVRVKELVELVGLSHKSNSKPKDLSGGEKQRVAIARALALNPKILLCDEATSALDPKTTKDILQLLRKINETLNVTIVLVTHEMEVIKSICHKVALIDKGEIKLSGYVKDIFLKPGDFLKKTLGEEDEVRLEGLNIKIFFDNNKSSQSIITSMARDLGIDFSIVFGRLERFRDEVLGNLVISLEKENLTKVIDYLEKEKMIWEVI